MYACVLFVIYCAMLYVCLLCVCCVCGLFHVFVGCLGDCLCDFVWCVCLCDVV